MDKDTFIAHITEHAPKWLRIAQSMLPQRDCEDALQSATLSAWEHLAQLRDEQAFDAWFKQILINRCRQMQRTYKREKDLLKALPANERGPQEWDLDAALSGLTSEEQRLIHLHHEQGYSLKEMAGVTGQSEDVLKMRLYRARKRLKIALITLLLLFLLAAIAVGSGLIDVHWFWQNRRAEPVAQSAVSVLRSWSYSGETLAFEVRDAVFHAQDLSLSFVYAIAGKDTENLFLYAGNLGVDGVRFDHVWAGDEVLPLEQWAGGKNVLSFSVRDWTLGGRHLICTQDDLPEGTGQTFYAQLSLNSLPPALYESLLEEGNTLELTTTLTVTDPSSNAVLETGTASLWVDAPSLEEWRKLYEAYHL